MIFVSSNDCYPGFTGAIVYHGPGSNVMLNYSIIILGIKSGLSYPISRERRCGKFGNQERDASHVKPRNGVSGFLYMHYGAAALRSKLRLAATIVLTS